MTSTSDDDDEHPDIIGMYILFESRYLLTVNQPEIYQLSLKYLYYRKN